MNWLLELLFRRFSKNTEFCKLMPKIFIAGLFHETHTFLEKLTELSDFEIRKGETLRECQGDSSPMGGALEFFAKRDYEIVPGPDYRAVPSGTVKTEVIDRFWAEFSESWNPNVDGIFLVLHGAMVSEGILDVEGEILRRIRELRGAAELPIYGVYDLHANFSQAMASHADCLVGYRENPHSDAREACVRAAALMDDEFQTGSPRPVMAYQGTDLVWAPTATGTADDPMCSLEAMARQMEVEAADSILAISVNAGFAFADTPDTRVSFTAVTRAPDDMTALDALAALANELNPVPAVADLPVDKVMSEIVANPIEGVTILTEPSDNIGAGAPGDTTGLLRALIKYDVENSAISIYDPDAVSMLKNCDIAEKRTLGIGGKGSQFDEGPVEIDVELISKSDGHFELVDKNSHLASMSGDTFEMGPCAVVRHCGITILLTSERVPPFDLGQWTSQGIDPAKLSVIVVKAAVAHRQGYDPMMARTFAVDTPGPCRSDLSQFEFVNRRITSTAES